MKKVLLFILLTGFSVTLFSQSIKTGQTRNQKKERPYINRTPPKNWGKKKYTNPIKSKLKDNVTSWDFGITLGGANSLTDIFGNAEESRGFVMDMQLSQTNFTGGMFMRYKFSPVMAFNIGVNYVSLQGADSVSSVEKNKIRNNSFKNDIFEFYGRAEFYRPRPVVLFQPRKQTQFDFYGFVGLAGFYHKPEIAGTAAIADNYFSDPDDYSNFQLGIPFGVGFYFSFPNKLRLGGEGYWMKTFTDYLDGFTTKASTGNDNYLAAKISLSYVFKQGRSNNRRRW